MPFAVPVCVCVCMGCVLRLTVRSAFLSLPSQRRGRQHNRERQKEGKERERRRETQRRCAWARPDSSVLRSLSLRTYHSKHAPTPNASERETDREAVARSSHLLVISVAPLPFLFQSYELVILRRHTHTHTCTYTDARRHTHKHKRLMHIGGGLPHRCLKTPSENRRVRRQRHSKTRGEHVYDGEREREGMLCT